MQFTPVIALHASTALAALCLGPVALWARMGRQTRPALHRAVGYAWVTLMLVAALSALWIRDYLLPNLAGFSPIHLLVPYTLACLALAFWHVYRRNFAKHRLAMLRLYLGACVGAGLFTLVPGRLLGQWVWGTWLGLL